MRRHRSDNNSQEIVELLRAAGVTVIDLSQTGNGVPVKLLGWCGQTYIMEIKNGPLNWKYTPAQYSFRAKWNGSPILTFESIEDAMSWICK